MSTVPTDDKVSVLIPAHLYERLVRVAESLTPGGTICSADDIDVEWLERVSVEDVVEAALSHYLEDHVYWAV